MIRRPRRSPLFPYTTLFRSEVRVIARAAGRVGDADAEDRDALGEEVVVVIAGKEDQHIRLEVPQDPGDLAVKPRDRKSTRLNSSHQITSYAVFCLKKKTTLL